MHKVKDFFISNWKLVGLVILLLFVLVLGILLGNVFHSNQELKASEKQYKIERESLLKQIEESKKNAQLDIDSARIYQQYAANQALVSEKINIKTKQVKNEISKEVSDIANINSDSVVILFSRLSEDYIATYPR